MVDHINIKRMSLSTILGHAISDKITIIGFMGSGLLMAVLENNQWLSAVPGVLIVVAAVWKHIQTARKSKAEADKAQSDVDKNKEEIIKMKLENELLKMKLEQERMKTKNIE